MTSDLAADSFVLIRSIGAVLASAAGDALGAPHEFGPPLPSTIELSMSGGGSCGWEPGEWTDDTQMALAILTPLAHSDRRIDAVADGFYAWFRSHPADVGIQTARVLSSLPPLTAASVRYQGINPSAAGNGGLMRIAPAALAFAGDPARIATYAAAVTELTHRHEDCVDASVLWAIAIDHTVHHAGASEVPWDFIAAVQLGLDYIPDDRRDRWARFIDEARRTPAVEFDNNGWVVHAFQAALAAIVSTPVPVEDDPRGHLVLSIRTAVRCGNDADTVAAIAGALVGARWGLEAIPSEWIAVLHGRRTYDAASLNASDVVAMTSAAVGAGSVASALRAVEHLGGTASL